MKNKFRKNGALIGVIVLVLCLAIYLNWSYERNRDMQETTAQGVFAAGPQEDAKESAAVSDEQRFEENRWEIKTLSEDAAGENEPDARLDRLCAGMDEMRLSLETSRSSELSLLRQTVENTDASAEAKASAEAQIAAIAENSVMEAKLESLIVAKGFVDCIALVGTDSVSVVIVPEKEGLQPSDVAKISDIILTETDFDTTQIRVIESQ